MFGKGFCYSNHLNLCQIKWFVSISILAEKMICYKIIVLSFDTEIIQ